MLSPDGVNRASSEVKMKILKSFILILATIMLFSACAPSNGGNKTTQPGDENLREVNGTELMQTLINTPYKSEIKNVEYGLSSASKVGADEKAFSKVLYPLPESGFAFTYNVEEYDITENGADNTRKLNNLISSLAGKQGLKKIVFRQGTYRFSGTIQINNVDDLYIAGNNTEFVFTEWCEAINAQGCKNLHFNGVAIDYNPSPAVAGTVVSCDERNKRITIKIGEEFDLSAERYDNGKIKYGSYMEFKTAENGDLYPNPDGNLLYNSTGDKINNIENGSFNKASKELTLTFKTMKRVASGVKVSVAFTMYEYATFVVKNCENVYLESCKVYCSAGMTFAFTTVKNSYLNRTDIILKEGSERLMTATADGFHGNDCTGDIVITGSIYENSHDDSINICSFYKNITSNYAKTITCSGTVSTNFAINVGDTVEIYDPATFKLFGSYTVKEVENSFLTYTITVDKFITENLVGKIVGNATRCPEITIKDCIFRNKRNRGILLQSRNSSIENCAFYNIVHGAVSIHSVLDIFAEALVPRDVSVKNNKFINNNAGFGLEGDVSVFAYGSSAKPCVGAIKRIKIENNFIYGCAQAGVSFMSCGDCYAENNLFFDIGKKRSSDKLFAAVRVVASEGIYVKRNCAVLTGNEPEFALIKEDDGKVRKINQSGNIIKIGV